MHLSSYSYLFSAGGPVSSTTPRPFFAWCATFRWGCVGAERAASKSAWSYLRRQDSRMFVPHDEEGAYSELRLFGSNLIGTAGSTHSAGRPTTYMYQYPSRFKSIRPQNVILSLASDREQLAPTQNGSPAQQRGQRRALHANARYSTICIHTARKLQDYARNMNKRFQNNYSTDLSEILFLREMSKEKKRGNGTGTDETSG